MSVWHSRSRCPACSGTGENPSAALKICDVCLSLGYMYKPSEAFRELGIATCERLKFLEKMTPALPLAIVIDIVVELDRFIRGIDQETDPDSDLNETLASDIRKGRLTRYASELRKQRDQTISELRRQRLTSTDVRPSVAAAEQAMLGNYQEAEHLFAEALKRYPGNGYVHYDYGTYLMCFKRQYKEAMWHLEDAIRDDKPGRAAMYLAAADCASELESHAKAQIYYIMCTLTDDFAALDEQTQQRVQLEVMSDGAVN